MRRKIEEMKSCFAMNSVKMEKERVGGNAWVSKWMEKELDRMWNLVNQVIGVSRQPGQCWCGAWVWPKNNWDGEQSAWDGYQHGDSDDHDIRARQMERLGYDWYRCDENRFVEEDARRGEESGRSCINGEGSENGMISPKHWKGDEWTCKNKEIKGKDNDEGERRRVGMGDEGRKEPSERQSDGEQDGQPNPQRFEGGTISEGAHDNLRRQELKHKWVSLENCDRQVVQGGEEVCLYSKLDKPQSEKDGILLRERKKISRDQFRESTCPSLSSRAPGDAGDVNEAGEDGLGEKGKTEDKKERTMTLQEAKNVWKVIMDSVVEKKKKCTELQGKLEDAMRKVEHEKPRKN